MLRGESSVRMTTVDGRSWGSARGMSEERWGQGVICMEHLLSRAVRAACGLFTLGFTDPTAWKT